MKEKLERNCTIEIKYKRKTSATRTLAGGTALIGLSNVS
jgi:hypothetical protein